MTEEPSARFDAATKLKAFFHIERALTIACAAWVPRVHRIEAKAALAQIAWQRALTAGSLRERVFELRYPERDLSPSADAELAPFEMLVDQKGTVRFLGTLAGSLDHLRSTYEDYLDASDAIADGPTFRILEHALADLTWAAEESTDRLEDEPAGNDVPGGTSIPDQPNRDDRYHLCSFYWPDIVDPEYPYGEGVRLQLRSAISHLNEVWAVETAGAILVGFEHLGWDFITDAARWLYDESRHMSMGARRLDEWGFDREEVPLGSYIYEAAAGEPPLTRLGMLAYFETKNIGKKKERAVELGRLGDASGHRDMDFDWADEAIHASYGRRWMKAALEAAGRSEEEWRDVVAGCEDLVARRVAAATDAETADVRRIADSLVAKAELTLSSA